MKRESVRTATARIAVLEVQEQRLMLLIQFPPPACRSVALWRRVQSDALLTLQRELIVQRQELARLTGQLDLDLMDAPSTVRYTD